MEEGRVAYIDANIFLYAILGRGKKKNAAKDILERIMDGKLLGFTSALTYDEILWKTRQERGAEDALLASKAFLTFPNLRLIDVNTEILWGAHSLIERYNLGPRDAIHAACALAHRVFTLISEDRDFDRIEEIKRKGLGDI